MKTMAKIITVMDCLIQAKTIIANSFKEVSTFAKDPFYCGRFCNPIYTR